MVSGGNEASWWDLRRGTPLVIDNLRMQAGIWKSTTKPWRRQPTQMRTTMRRRTLILCLLLVVSIFPAGALPVSGQQTPPVPLGFPAAEGADFQALRRAGGNAVKLVADWSALEPEPGEFAWDALDEAVAAARKSGLRVALVLAYTPKWASLATGPELSDPVIYSRQPPRRLSDWEKFVSAIATRYRSSVKDWQVWTTLSLPQYRGTVAEYLALLRAARSRVRAADPSSRLLLASPHGIDLPFIRRALLEAADAFDTIVIAPGALPPEALLRPFGVLRDRLLIGTAKRLWIEWDPLSVGERATWRWQLVKVEAIARAFGIEQVFWTMDALAGTQSVLQLLAVHVGRKPFVGYLARDRAIALVFGDTDPTVVAWSTAGDAVMTLDGENIEVYTPVGGARDVTPAGGKISLGIEPLLIRGLSGETAREARQTLQARGLPVPPAPRDYSQAGEVSATLGRQNAELGLYNMLYRSRESGDLEIVEIEGSEAVRTRVEREAVYVYFDVDDSFAFFVDGRLAIEISVEVRAASAAQQLGFNIYYDAMTGYRFSSWQWVEAGTGWVTHSIRLMDVAFANTWGWDFAVNAAGNRREDLIVRTVTVRKRPR